MAEEKQTIERFSRARRIEHIILLVSFSLLGFTGLVQRFSGSGIGEFLIGVMGGIELVRIIHRANAVVFTVLSIYHLINLAYLVFVRRIEMSMLPGVRDLTDALDSVRYNLGLTKERPKLPRYNFAEKAEYWALVWGGIVMGITGFILWNPVVIAKILPGQVIPAAKAAHGLEAILAVVAILIWHFYHVHLKLFNKAMFTGKMTREQMEHEHGEELARLEQGKMRALPPADVMRRRERVFIPVAALATITSVVLLVFLTTYEKTAITTVPPASANVPAFAPLTPTTVPTPAGGVDNTKIGAAMKHGIVGQEQCLSCHAAKSISPMPANHDGRPLESCLVCHKPGPTPTPGAAKPASGAPGAITHAIEGREKCDQCHAGAGSLKPVPADHSGRANNTCAACHKPVGAQRTPAAGAPVATSAPPAGAATAAPAASGPKGIPANHDLASAAYKDCALCHGAGKVKPVPANHSAYTAETCQGCHKPAAATPAVAATAAPAASGPKGIPANHDLASAAYKDCALCHGAGKVKPVPANHSAYTAETCQGCHKPAK